MNKRFNLESLPLCGAKTRSGAPCKRRGNKRNGRCKLHGGNSTGAKTEQGKMASRLNALKQFPSWYFGEPIPMHYQQRAYRCFERLYTLMTTQPINWQQVFHLIDVDRIPLEMLKYQIMELTSANELLMLQIALDRYYQEQHSAHLSFTVYLPQLTPNSYIGELSKPQREYLDNWLHKHNPLKGTCFDTNK
ncbi:HGGxSTG domain-containing protein [Photobacterium piscicola]|uniref:HGGxSTG domain-containing protein n=1 Tax=Photobacterium piscicola TaxID=1378299 RepID=UPI0037369DC3